jgi:hypothetical protein
MSYNDCRKCRYQDTATDDPPCKECLAASRWISEPQRDKIERLIHEKRRLKTQLAEAIAERDALQEQVEIMKALVGEKVPAVITYSTTDNNLVGIILSQPEN